MAYITVKKPDNGERPKFGFLLAIGKPIVYLKNMYDLQELESMEKVERKEYPASKV